MYYTDELKKEVVNKVLNKELTQIEAMKKYGIEGHSTIARWIHKFSNFEEKDTKGEEMKEKRKDIAEMKERIQRLEKLLADKEIELTDQRMKADILEKIIELSEKDLNVQLKKNIGSKR